MARKWMSAGLALSLTLSQSGMALADDAQRKSDAKAFLSIGADNFTQGKYDDALKYFLRAHETYPESVKIYFNLGQAYAKLGRDAEAGESYSSFLAGTEGDAALAGQRKVVKDALDKMKGKFAVVPLQIVPDDARKGADVTVHDDSDPTSATRHVVGNLVVFVKPSATARYQLNATYQDLKLAQPVPIAALQAGPTASAVLLSLAPSTPSIPVKTPIVVNLPKTDPKPDPVVATLPKPDPKPDPKTLPPLVRADDTKPKVDAKPEVKPDVPRADPKTTEPEVKTLLANSDHGTTTTAGGLDAVNQTTQPVTTTNHFPAIVAFGATAVLGAGWGVSAYLAKKQSDKISKTPQGDCNDGHNPAECNDFQRKAWLANILGAGTVVAAGTGVLLLIFAPTETVDGAGGEVSLRGTF